MDMANCGDCPIGSKYDFIGCGYSRASDGWVVRSFYRWLATGIRDRGLYSDLNVSKLGERYFHSGGFFR